MKFNRPEAKYRARLAMRGAYPHPMLVTLVYILLTGVLTSVIMYFVSNPFSLAYWYLIDGEDPQRVLHYIFTPQRVSVYLLMELLITLYQWVMQFGYTAYALGLARRTGPGYRTLLEGFSHLGKALLVSFLTALFTSLWGLLVMLPGIVVLTVGAAVESAGLVFLGVLLLLAGTVVDVAISYRYRLATYFLLDRPDMGALASITASKQAMRGHKLEMFCLDFSFFWWWILSAFTLGILSLWVGPYAWASEANFYHWVVYGSFPNDQPGFQDSGYQGSSYQSPYDDNKPNF